MKIPFIGDKAKTEETITPQLSLGDVLSPSEIEVDFNHIRISSRYFRTYFVSLYVSVPSTNLDELRNTSKLVESTLASLSITAQPTTLQMEDGFKSTLPVGQDFLNLTHNMDTTSLATTFPFASSELTANEGIM